MPYFRYPYLRTGAPNDKMALFKWRNLLEVYEYGNRNCPVTIEEHERWFDSVLDTDKHLLWIVEPNAGMVRLDRRNDDPSIADISIFLLSDFRGMGFGTLFIREACELGFTEWEITEIRAVIRQENTASFKSFTKAGFTIKKGEADYYQAVFFKERKGKETAREIY